MRKGDPENPKLFQGKTLILFFMVQPSIVFEPGGIVKWKRNDKHSDFTKIIIFKEVIKMANRGKEPFIRSKRRS